MPEEKSGTINRSRPVVLVTGANGFVGRHLTPVLSRAGWEVRRVVRTSLTSTDDEVALARSGLLPTGLTQLLACRPWFIWPPECISSMRKAPIELYRTINAEGTVQLVRSAAKAGVKRFIFVSTMLVNGSCTDGRAPFRENDEFSPRGVYGLSKAEAELGLARMSTDVSMQITIIRPPLVYGPGAAGNFRLLVRTI